LQTTLAVIVLFIFAAAGADPVLTLFSWLTNVGTLGVIALMAITSFSVLMFFRANPQFGSHPLANVLLPLLSGIALVIVLALAVIHFDVLTGASSRTLAVVLPSLILIAAILGVVLAGRLRRTDPARFANLGIHKL
jgi:hypothetical protein